MAIEYFLLVGSVLILASIALAKFSDNLGVPTLLLFLGVGMFAGSEGPGNLYFDNAQTAQSIGIVALLFILFAAGLDTRWETVRPLAGPAAALSTLGVLLTALLVGVFAVHALGFSPVEGLLLGAIVSSTDAAAVFSVLRSQKLTLKNNLKPLLELESGSNDPMAVFLTIGLVEHLLNPSLSWMSLGWLFVFQMGLGAAFGYAFGKAMAYLLNRIKLPYEGIYPVFVLAFAALIYGATAVLKGSGFLAVYIAGILVGNSGIVQKKSLLRFFDGMAWLSQIAMFVTLGLLVFPSRLAPIIPAGLAVSVFLMFAARPLSVFAVLSFSKLTWREKLFVSWVGLRGAVPIVLATFPLLAGLPRSGLLFNLVFFIVLTSVLFQGWTIPFAARALGLSSPLEKSRRSPIEFAPTESSDTDLLDFMVPYGSEMAGKTLVEIGMPKDSLVVFILRDEQFVVPSGGTVIEEGDILQVLGSKKSFQQVQALLSRQKKTR